MNIKDNIDRYMDLKGIRYYSDLLIEIGRHMGKSRADAEVFATQQKANFSKMLKGDRPLNHDYYIPLEEIFGVPMAKLLNGQAYPEGVLKDDIPFLRGFRYYAYKDDLALYEELDKASTPEGDEILSNSDEYNRFFLDYLIEYRSHNGIRYLAEKRGFHYDDKGLHQYVLDESMPLSATLPIEIAKLILEMDDPSIFYKIYDPFEMDIDYSILDQNCVYADEGFVEALAGSEAIFASLFEGRYYPFGRLNKGVFPLDGVKEDVHLLNPLLNMVLDYCLDNLAKYKPKAKRILEFGKAYNKDVLGKLRYPVSECCLDEEGRLTYRKSPWLGSLVKADASKVEDATIKKMVLDLPLIQKEGAR